MVVNIVTTEKPRTCLREPENKILRSAGIKPILISIANSGIIQILKKITEISPTIFNLVIYTLIAVIKLTSAFSMVTILEWKINIYPARCSLV